MPGLEGLSAGLVILYHVMAFIFSAIYCCVYHLPFPTAPFLVLDGNTVMIMPNCKNGKMTGYFVSVTRLIIHSPYSGRKCSEKITSGWAGEGWRHKINHGKRARPKYIRGASDDDDAERKSMPHARKRPCSPSPSLRE